ncbi:MAG: hypothetical protein V7L25_21385 [Nostoc sp.]|uniref:hypothetical protein n=1 Tax=Nostoc sp. TaxID=1180 RepID=UPI002FF097C8
MDVPASAADPNAYNTWEKIDTRGWEDEYQVAMANRAILYRFASVITRHRAHPLNAIATYKYQIYNLLYQNYPA